MQYVNDDMDELFRSAAENYPLDTNSADWDKVLTALQGETQTIPEKKGNKNGRLLWLLLLLPLGLICNQLSMPGVSNNKETTGAEIVNKPISGEPEKMQSKGNSSHFNETGTNKNEKTTTNDVTAIDDKGLNSEGQTENFLRETDHLQKNSYASNAARSNRTNKNYNIDDDIFSTSPLKNQNRNNNDFSDNEVYQRRYTSEITFGRMLKEPVTSVNRSLNPLINSPEQNSRQKTSAQKSRKFYAGLMGGIDATTIKFQKIDNAGATYGVLFGYEFNKKWSIETGAYLDKKYYYTKGRYFNSSKIYRPQSTARMDNISGNCKMFEVPVSVKYNFSSHKNSGWFATAGTTSYFMKKENYAFDAYYGSWGPYPEDTTFRNSSRNFVSAVSISGGYTHRLGNFADLRVEPYVKLPVSGMGIGSLRLYSAGLQVGLTRKF